MWLFNNAIHQNEIHSMLIYGNDNAVTTSSPNYERSHNQYLACLPFALTTAACPCLTERTSCWWVQGWFLAVISLSRKSDVKECRSRPWVVTRRRSFLVESFVTSLALDLSPSRLIVLDVVLNWISEGHLCVWRKDSLKEKYKFKYYKIYVYLIFRVCK